MKLLLISFFAVMFGINVWAQDPAESSPKTSPDNVHHEQTSKKQADSDTKSKLKDCRDQSLAAGEPCKTLDLEDGE